MKEEKESSIVIALHSNISQYKHEKEIFDLKVRHDIDKLDLETSNKYFFTNNIIVDIFISVIATISIITTMIIIYVLSKHNKLGILVVSLALQQVREISTSTTKKEDKNYMCNCTSQYYIILALSIIIIG